MVNVELDFKMLLTFKALIETGQVSGAADKLNTGQSNISRALAKLRKHFADPLFVRTRKGMEPTPKALKLMKTVDEILQLYQETLQGHANFDPATSDRVFHIAGSDVSHVLGFSRFAKTIFKLAPSVQLHGVPLGVGMLAQQLETDTDMAFGPFPKLFAGIHERRLFTERYACLVRRDHPTIGDSITLDQFRNSQHIVVSARRLGHIHEHIHNEIIQAIPPENQRIITHNFMTAALLAETTDFIVTLPTGTATELRRSNLRVLPPPFDLPPLDIKLYWHERFHHDPAHVWLRGLIYDAFAEVDDISANAFNRT